MYICMYKINAPVFFNAHVYAKHKIDLTWPFMYCFPC